MDYRQEQIIKTWFDEGVKAGFESYFCFISLWISFNAYCVAKCSIKANRRLAQINNDSGFKKLSEDSIEITEGTILRKDGRYSIDIKQPGRVHIVIKEKFIESAVFDAFARDFCKDYLEMLKEDNFTEAVEKLYKALEKEDGHSYVINMTKAGLYSLELSYKELKNRNIIIPFEDTTKLSQLINVLYQIRCNLFHGEKQPGVINDDKIVGSANPVLMAILVKLKPIEQSNSKYVDENYE